MKTNTTASGSCHAMFSGISLEYVDRVMVLRINTEEMQIETVLDVPIAKALTMMATESDGKRALFLGGIGKIPKPRGDLKEVRAVSFRNFVIRELETGTIEVEREREPILPAEPALRDVALLLNISLLNPSGTPLTTRQLVSAH